MLLVPILGDQLTPGLGALAQADRADTVVLMMEVADETRYVRHHRRKIALILSAMRHHAARLERDGWTVDYVRLDDPANTGGFTGEVARAVARHGATRVAATEPGEWRVRRMMNGWERELGVPVEVREDGRFICSHDRFRRWADGRAGKEGGLVMEEFYRELRRETKLLMDGARPCGNRWNFDAENRRRAAVDLLTPRPLHFEPDQVTRDVLALVAERFPDHPGSLDDFGYAVTAEDAERQAAHFLRHALPQFGDYEDAMLSGEGTLWHSVLSPYLNLGLLDPLDLCRRAEAEHRAGRAPLNSVEGYVRQILGWREYVRGIYWREGPAYAHRNHLRATRALPAFYWTGETDMRCLAEAIGQTLDTAHAHHIQRLMVTGNFALLIGADPFQVHQWYLEVYDDAYEWVELPNTLGMSQFADGGLLGTKPYAGSGAYIDRMSDYCGRCRYDPAKRTGPDACPFNALYWDFLARNRDRLGDNHRLFGPYAAWDRTPAPKRAAVRAQAAGFLERLEAEPAYALD